MDAFGSAGEGQTQQYWGYLGTLYKPCYLRERMNSTRLNITASNGYDDVRCCWKWMIILWLFFFLPFKETRDVSYFNSLSSSNMAHTCQVIATFNMISTELGNELVCHSGLFPLTILKGAIQNNMPFYNALFLKYRERVYMN